MAVTMNHGSYKNSCEDRNDGISGQPKRKIKKNEDVCDN